ncbi:MAG: hypothetical protein IT445_07055 [Phycisphaeraceae bacterium]|nr:hypothetical protein [Phycisphaeraceae bacterium]
MNKVAITCLIMMWMVVASSPPARSEEQPADAAYVAQHKQFIFLRARVEDGNVSLTFMRGPWYDDKDQPLFEHVRIYRRQVDFLFGKDRDEYFHGLTCSDDDLIHEGPVQVNVKRSFRWVDENVTVGATYAYWVGLPGGAPNGPVGVRVRDPRVWWPMDKVAAATRKLQEDFPDMMKVAVAGRTLQGRDIWGLTVGDSDKRVALIGAVHASEAGPELILYAVRDLLENHREIFDDVSIVAIPCVNLDERQHAVEGVPWYLRRNMISVDLNRNFPGDWEKESFMYGGSSADPDSGTYRGPYPVSEPETQAVVSFLKNHPPTVVLSYHHLCSVAGYCLWAPAAAAEDAEYIQRCREVFDAYARGYVRPDDPADDHDYLRIKTTPGSLPTWSYRQFNAPGFDVERHSPDALASSLTDQVTPEQLLDNQQRHVAAILSLMQSLR